MEYLQKLTKKDLLSLLSFCRIASDVSNTNHLENLFRELKTLILFDCAVTIYIGSEVLHGTNKPKYRKFTMDFSKEFINTYINEFFYERSAICQALFTSWHCMNWKSVWAEGLTGRYLETKEFAIDYGYLDGWVGARHSQSKECISIFALAGQKVENNQRSNIILNYLKPHITEAISKTFKQPLKRDRVIARCNISPRELEILRWYEEGKTAWEISTILSRSENTIKWHTYNILRKLNAQNRTHAIALALRQGLIE